MRLKKIRLQPFGGLALKELEFTGGLNVVLGPNEAGKTTVFHALEHSLFTRTDLPPARLQKEMGRFLPVEGGDTVQVEAHFLDGDRLYNLQRSWGRTGRSVLTLPGGSILSDEDEIMNKLQSLLGAGEGTYRSILMTYQSGLTPTLQQLKGSFPETLQSLGDILRKSVLETDGVSVDGFREMIERNYDEHFSHWDPATNLPERGRGIQNPYTKSVGLILAAYYEKERTQLRLEEALDYEARMDSLLGQMKELTGEIGKKEVYLEQHRDAYEAAGERRLTLAQLEAVRARTADLKEANKNWPVLDARVAEITARLPELEARERELRDESDKAQKEEKGIGLRKQYHRVIEVKKLLENAEIELSKVKKLTGDDFEKLEGARARVELLKTRQHAGRLSMAIHAKRDLTLSVEKDGEKARMRDYKGGEVQNLEADGRLKLEHHDWTIEVHSGRGIAGEGEEEVSLKEAQDHLQRLCAQFGIDNPSDAKELNRVYEEKLQAVKSLRERFKSELGDSTLEELESRIRELGPEKETRALSDIVTELTDVQGKLNQMRRELQESQERVDRYKGSYGSQDQLLLKVAEAVQRERELEESLGKLPPLPEGVEDAESFIEEYGRMAKEMEGLREQQNELKVKLARLEGEAPDVSPEELKEIAAGAEQHFNAALRRGGAIERIRKLALQLVEELDRSTYQDLEQKLAHYISILTGSRYDRIDMEESLPRGFVRGDGALLPVELLSTGTMDVLALSLRLTMAEYFLQNFEGFMIMDDPLVNLDPDRQKLASEVISSFAGEHQLLLFTCHPSHAELLGGNLIKC